MVIFARILIVVVLAFILVWMWLQLGELGRIGKFIKKRIISTVFGIVAMAVLMRLCPPLAYIFRFSQYVSMAVSAYFFVKKKFKLALFFLFLTMFLFVIFGIDHDRDPADFSY